jgi:hypothetical protein
MALTELKRFGKKSWLWLVGKVYNFSRVLTRSIIHVHEKDNFEHLKDGAFEGFPLCFKEFFSKPYGMCNIANSWVFGT